MNLKKIIFGGFLALSLFSTNAMAVPTTSPDVLGQSLVEYAEKLIHRAKEYVEWAREEQLIFVKLRIRLRLRFKKVFSGYNNKSVI